MKPILISQLDGFVMGLDYAIKQKIKEEQEKLKLEEEKPKE
jgi:hypothetical protein